MVNVLLFLFVFIFPLNSVDAKEKKNLPPISRVAVISGLDTQFHNNYKGGLLGPSKTYSFECPKVEELNEVIEHSLGGRLEKELGLEVVDAKELRVNLPRKEFHLEKKLMKDYRSEFAEFASEHGVDAFVILRPIMRHPPGQEAANNANGGGGFLGGLLFEAIAKDIYSGVDLNIKPKTVLVFCHIVVYDMRPGREAKVMNGKLFKGKQWVLQTKFAKGKFENVKRPIEAERDEAVQLVIDNVDNEIPEAVKAVGKVLKKNNR